MRHIVFSFLAVILVLAFSSCKTCSYKEVVQEKIIEQISGHSECSNYDEMKDDISPILKKLGFCNEYDASKVKLPDGIWAYSAICCLDGSRAIEKLYGNALPKSWGCKSKFDFSIMSEECMGVEQ